MARRPEQIIDAQIRAWELQQAPRGGTPPPEGHPLITISRAYGARGAALANALAHRTGFAVWDATLVQAVAEEVEGNKRLMETLDEHRRKAIDDFVHAALQHGRHTNLQYLRGLMRVVHTIAAHGDALIVGRGANFICAPGTALRVRVVCPLDVRAQRIADKEGLDDRQARRRIEEVDADRADFVRHHFRHDTADPVNYDLVLNSDAFNLEQLADLTLAAYAARFGTYPSVDSGPGSPALARTA